jgi:hypothetical protein
MRRDLEMDELRCENAQLREALAIESAAVTKLKLEVQKMNSTSSHIRDSSPTPNTPSSRRRLLGLMDNGRTGGVSLWNNTDEEKEKLFAVLKEGR